MRCPKCGSDNREAGEFAEAAALSSGTFVPNVAPPTKLTNILRRLWRCSRDAAGKHDG
jgi:hypothetical protein